MANYFEQCKCGAFTDHAPCPTCEIKEMQAEIVALKKRLAEADGLLRRCVDAPVWKSYRDLEVLLGEISSFLSGQPVVNDSDETRRALYFSDALLKGFATGYSMENKGTAKSVKTQLEWNRRVLSPQPVGLEPEKGE